MSLNDFQRTNAIGPDTLFALPHATSQTYAPTDTPPKEVIVEPLALTRLPAAMRNMGWYTAAALMQRWFDSPAWEMPEEWKKSKTQPKTMSLSPAQCDQSIVKMGWAMGFERCRDAVEAAKSLVSTAKGIDRLNSLLQIAGWRKDLPFELGFYNMSAVQMESISQVNFTLFGEAWDTLDDMYGALGNATLKVGVVGRAFNERDPVTHKNYSYFRVEHLGFYIRDHYDFNGLQYLGTWTENRILTKSETGFSLTPGGHLVQRLVNGPFAMVTNKDFRSYREKLNKGGDFIIYSDVLWQKSDQIIFLGE